MQDRQGFTLIEVLVTSSLVVVVLVALYLLYKANQTVATQDGSQTELEQSARVALEMMAREIRMAGFDPSGALAAQASPTTLQVAEANTLAFIADVTGDLVSDQVVYRLTGDQLIRELASWSGSSWTAPIVNEVADHVTALTFQYFDATGAPTATLANIRRVQISLSTGETAGGRTQAYPLVTDVQLKNMAP